MEFSNLPKHRKEQLAQLTTGTSRIALSLLMGLFGVGLIWSVDSALPPAQEFPEYSQVVPDVPWDFKFFEDVDYANPATTEQVAYGRRLIMETADYLGPNSSKPFAGNNLDCNSCHLDGGLSRLRRLLSPYLVSFLNSVTVRIKKGRYRSVSMAVCSVQ